MEVIQVAPMTLCHSGLALLLWATTSPMLAQDPALPGETPTDATVKSWLESPQPRIVAWGAHYVLADRRTTLLPQVEGLIELWEQKQGEQKQAPLFWQNGRFNALILLLDTVIQMHGQVPVKTLDRMDFSLDAEKVLLLLQMPWDDAGPEWEAIYHRTTTLGYPATRIAAQMLAQYPPPRFAAGLAEQITVHGKITVLAPGVGAGYGSGGVIIGDCGNGPPVEADWPRIPEYIFLPSARPKAAKVLLDGSDPVYLVREEDRDHPAESYCGRSVQLSDNVRLHLLTAMAGEPPNPATLDLTPKLTIDFKDREGCRQQVVQFVEGQQRKFAAIAASLTARGLMTEQERQNASLRIELHLLDARGEGAVDLPAIAFRPPVTWAAR